MLSRIDGKPCVKLEVYKEADANIVDVARRVRDRVFGTPDERRRLDEIVQKERALASGDPAALAAREKELAAEREASKGKKGPQGERRGGGPGKIMPAGLGGSPGEKGRPGFLAARLPPGDELRILSDQSVFIQTSLDDVVSRTRL